jgi:Arabinogalactan endo-1,4-beta-galactosidase
MKHLPYLFLFVLILNSFVVNAQQREHINFDDNWKFHFGDASDPAKDFNYGITSIFSKSGKTDNTALALKFNDDSWRSLNLPHDWAVELPFVNSPNFDVMAHGYKPVGGIYPTTSIGWYRKHFSVPHSDSGRRLQIQFDGRFRDANIWLNGFYLGNNKSGYLGVSYDITDYVNYDRDNVLVVRVDATQYEGWFYEGAGIYRHVWLNKYNNAHFADNGLFVYTKNQSSKSDIYLQTTLSNQSGHASQLEVSSYITEANGKIVARLASISIKLNADEESTFTHNVSISNPHLWSIEDPYLYRVVSLVKQNGKVIDSLKMRFGIRTVSITKDGLFVNGRYVKVYGTNNHQDHAGVGSAMPDYLYYYRVKLLKEMGSNAYRTSHNATAPELIEACDSLGMLVLDEQRLLNSSPEYTSQFERLIKRDRSHPSVFLWSIGNEEGWIQTTSTGKRIAESLLKLQKELDPTRISTYAADVGNTVKGVNEVIPVRGFNYREKFVADYHHDYPNQPIVGTEMGSTVTTRGIYVKDTINGYVPDQDITAPWWASTAESWWKLCAPNNWWMGGFVWTGFDYRGEPTPYQWPNINSHFGIMDVCGFPKNIYYYYQSWWTDKDVLHISPHWNWKGQEGKPIDVWVNTNADNVELFLNGKSLGKKDMPRNSHLQWSVPYEPGKLEAIAYKKGKKLEANVQTTGEPNTVVVTPYKTTMLADGKDVTIINISVVDRQGREVPDANNMISFSVKGHARIIGVGNGDPSSHEQDKYNDTAATRSLFNGHCQVILQSGNVIDKIHFEARAEHLYSGNTDIETVQPREIHKIVSMSGNRIFPKKKTDKMLGADISFLPELEARNIKFSDKGVNKEAIEILKDHGFNYIRLRIFDNPSAAEGYSPGKGFCDLNHTMQMAKRIKAAGLKFLLDFHYSDTWADPGKQFKPSAWKDLSFPQLRKAVYDYTKNVMQQLKDQGTVPDMVQVGNEINHGMIWPEGNIRNLDSLALLIDAGIGAVRAVSPSTVIMLHIALGGQNEESRFFLDNMIGRGLQFDVIGLSYYPRWHGTLTDLKNNLDDLATRYKMDVIVVEYSQYKKEVNEIAFHVAEGRGKGTCIWEPLSTWEAIFDKDGKSNSYLTEYDDIYNTEMKGER